MDSNPILELVQTNPALAIFCVYTVSALTIGMMLTIKTKD